MSAIIMIPQVIDSSIKEMCCNTQSQTVIALAEKYGFDAVEAALFLKIDDLKIVRKRGNNEDKKSEKKAAKKAAKKVADADKPKRALSGYLTYRSSVHKTVQEELRLKLPEGEKLKPQAVTSAIGANWKALDIGSRTHWNNIAKANAVVAKVAVEVAESEVAEGEVAESEVAESEE